MAAHVVATRADLPSLDADTAFDVAVSDWSVEGLEAAVRRRLPIRVPFEVYVGAVSAADVPGPRLEQFCMDQSLRLVAAYPKGTRVRAHSMRARSDLNGCCGTVAMAKEGRYGVAFDNGEKGMLAPANMVAVDTVAETAASALAELLAQPQHSDDPDAGWEMLEPEPELLLPLSRPPGAPPPPPSQKGWVASGASTVASSRRTRQQGVRQCAASVADSTLSRRPAPTQAIRPKHVSRMHTKGASSAPQPAVRRDAQESQWGITDAAVALTGGGLTADALAAQQRALEPPPREEQRRRLAALRARAPSSLSVRDLGLALLQCGWCVDTATAVLSAPARNAAAAAVIASVLAAVALGAPEPAAADEDGAALPAAAYGCRRCRRRLVSSEQLHPPHTAADMMRKGFRGKGKDFHSRGVFSGCASLWARELSGWIDTQSSDGGAGTLACPGCGAKVGAYCWTGAQCSCGAWVTPALQLHVSKLDVMRDDAPAGISLPASHYDPGELATGAAA